MHGAVVVPQFVGECLVVVGENGSFKTGHPRSRWWKIFMDVICVKNGKQTMRKKVMQI